MNPEQLELHPPAQGFESLNATERTVHDRQTAAFISMNESQISLMRLLKTDDGAGGRVAGPPFELEPQTVRVVGLRNPKTIVTE